MQFRSIIVLNKFFFNSNILLVLDKDYNKDYYVNIVLHTLMKTVLNFFASAFIVAPSALILSSPLLADTYVNGYYRSNGTYVAPHYRSSPNNTVTDNWSYKGNTNPYTGETGSNSYDSYNSYGSYSSY